MKVCNICKIEKKSNCFHNKKLSIDGLSSKCKKCKSIYDKKYRKKNIVKLVIQQKKRYEEKNDQILVQKRKYNKTNKVEKAKYNKEYYIENKEQIVKQQKEYAKNNPEIFKKKSIKRRALKLQLNEVFEVEHIKFVKFRFNYKCFNCNGTEKLCIDHHKPLSKGNILTLQNAVLLCGSCNSSKHNKDPEDYYTEIKLKELKKILRI